MVMDNHDADRQHVRIIQQWLEKRRKIDSQPDESRNPAGATEASPNEAEMNESARILCERYIDGLSRMFKQPGVSPAEREDLVQETLLRALRGLHRFRGDSPFRHWLFTIARNLRINAGRQRSARGKRETSFDEASAGVVVAPASHPLGERLREEALASLPPQQERCMRLRLQGNSIEEIATLMKLSKGAVKAHLFHARQHLRSYRASLEPERFLTRSTPKK